MLVYVWQQLLVMCGVILKNDHLSILWLSLLMDQYFWSQKIDLVG